MYRDVYPILTEKGSGRYPQMYAEEFVKAYERQIADYKRLGGDEHLKATVIMNESDLNPAPVIDVDAESLEDELSDDDFLEDQINVDTTPERTIAQNLDDDDPERAEG